MKRVFMTMLAILSLHGCGGSADVRTSQRVDHDTPPPDATYGGTPASAAVPAPSATDIAASQSLRRTLLADPSVSVDARNIMVYTAGGVMVLRGGITSDAERAKVVGAATKIPGVNRVQDEMQVLVRQIADQPGTNAQ